MVSPYKGALLEYVDTVTVVTVDRDGASPVIGTVVKVTDYGVYIRQPDPDPMSEAARTTFIAYENIRGITTVGWDLERTGKIY